MKFKKIDGEWVWARNLNQPLCLEKKIALVALRSALNGGRS